MIFSGSSTCQRSCSQIEQVRHVWVIIMSPIHIMPYTLHTYNVLYFTYNILHIHSAKQDQIQPYTTIQRNTELQQLQRAINSYTELTQLNRAIHSYTGPCKAIQGCKELYRVIHSNTKLYTAIQRFKQLNTAIRGYTHIQSYTQIYTATQGNTQLFRAIHS